MSFTGKIIIVTGGAKGIGAAVARRFCEQGGTVNILDIDETAGAGVMNELVSKGQHAVFRKCDVSCQDDITRALEGVIHDFGRIDILVNDAALQLNKGLLETSNEDFERVMRINVGGTFMLMRDVAQHMIANEIHGAIVNFSSTFAIVGSPGYFAYHASKGAIASMTRAAAIALLPYGIRVNAVAPGTTLTPGLLDGARDTGDEKKGLASFMALQPLKRFGTAEEIANAVVFLASDEASFVLGSNLVVDGAYTIV